MGTSFGLQSFYMLLSPWWRHQMETFSALLVICVRGIHRSPVNSLHKCQWRGALMFSVIWAWISAWVNNNEIGDLRRHHTHYDVTVIPWLLYTGNATHILWWGITINNFPVSLLIVLSSHDLMTWIISPPIALLQRQISGWLFNRYQNIIPFGTGRCWYSMVWNDLLWKGFAIQKWQRYFNIS